MKHTHNLLVELKIRENKRQTGRPINDSEFIQAFNEVAKVQTTIKILSRLLCVSISVIITLLIALHIK